LTRTAAFSLAILCAAVGSAIYRSHVFSQFVPVRQEVRRAEQSSSQGVIRIPLPDLSSLQDQRAVLGLRLLNDGSDARQVALFLDGFPTDRAVLPRGRATTWDIVLSPGSVRALIRDSSGSTRYLELRGDGDGWAVTGLDIRNYHMRVGDRPTAVSLPSRAANYTPAPGFLPVAAVLFVLAAVSALIPSPRARPVHIFGRGISLTACLICAVLLIIPLISSYIVLLSPFGFSLVAAALFTPVLLAAVHVLFTQWRMGLATIHRFWTRHTVTCERGAALAAFTAIGIAQPIFEVVGNSPEFFAARGTTALTAVAAVLAICLGVPVALLAIERGLRAISPRAAAAFHGLALAALSAFIVLPWFRRGTLVPSPWELVAGALIGLVVAVGYGRVPVIRQFLTALAPAAVVVPTVFVIFDELPLNSLLHGGGDIDAGRYPNFAALARSAYWFRDAMTVAQITSFAVPAILSGRYPPPRGTPPTLRNYPVNLFTTLARHYEITASLRFQKLCPGRACQDNAAMPVDTLSLLLSDLGLVWLHIVLPPSLTEQLPPVTDDWAEFGRTQETRVAVGGSGRGGVFRQFLTLIDDRPGRLYLIHSMVPHMPFEYVPSGRRYRGPDYGTNVYRRRGLFEGASAVYADTLSQRHLAQVGFADHLLGELLVRLRQVGVYDKALVIVTADHGASYRPGRPRRQLQPRLNASDILQVPLFVKLPGQQHGEVVDRIVETVDILPTVLQVVGARASLRFDGRSLLNPEDERSPRSLGGSNRRAVASGDLVADRDASLAWKEQRFGRGDPFGLYAPPGARHRLGTDVSRSPLQAARDVQVSIRNTWRFETVNPVGDTLPLYVGGTLTTSRPAPLTVAVTVNGIVAAIAQSYRERDDHLFGTLIPETSLKAGRNVVAAFVIEDKPTE
jgi:hypothetical protein